MLQEAITADPKMIFPVDQIGNMIGSLPYTDSFLCLTWTCIFSVKASFLALFSHLIRDVSPRLTMYFRCVIGYTFLTWMFLQTEGFIACPWFGMDSRKRYHPYI